MNINSKSRDILKYIFILLAIASVLANMKSIFTDFGVDSEYAIAMSYRMIQGDRMFVEMWEPHQTSAFLCTILMKLYVSLTGTLTGVVIYLQFMGLVIHGAITFVLYRMLKKYTKPEINFLMCLFFFTVRPKEIMLPEFSNMQIWFSTLLFCCLVSYFQEQRKKWMLLLAAIFLCLQIISYPSCLIVYFPVIYLLAKNSTERLKDILILSASCVFAGVLYLSYFIYNIGISEFGMYLKYILASDASHGFNLLDRISSYGQDVGLMLIMLAVVGILLIAVRFFCSLFQINKNKKNIISIISIFTFLLLFDLFNAVVIWELDRYNIAFYHLHTVKYIPIIIIGFLGLRFCNREEKQLIQVGTILAMGSFFATLILSNIYIFATLNYVILGIMVVMIPIAKILENVFTTEKKYRKYGMLILFCLVTILRRGIILKEAYYPINDNIFSVQGIVKSGPALGFVSSYMPPHMINITLKEWKEYVKPNDRVILVTDEGHYMNTLPYLFEDIEVSIHSTICNPAYDENLLDYWKLNPHKQPNVVVVVCWFGELHVGQDSWMMKWIENEFQPSTYVDGSYWRFYRLEE